MDQVYATRSELLARRARIRLAVQGGELLKERRGALIKESDRLGASVLESIDLLDREIAGAGQLLGIAVPSHRTWFGVGAVSWGECRLSETALVIVSR